MWRVIGGINLDPDSPGAGSVTISPIPGGGLSWARATHHTIRGPVSVSWKTDDGVLYLDVSVPPNMTGTVVIPGAAATEVTEGGLPIGSAPGVRLIGKRPAGLAVAIASGTYSFTARPRGAPETTGKRPHPATAARKGLPAAGTRRKPRR
jgi:alpha-L-rhamnosidase